MRKRGFTLIELVVAMVILGFLFLGTMAVFTASLRGFYNTKTDITLASDNTLGIERVSEALRSAVTMDISPDGTKVTYTLPKLSADVDPVTGEVEYYEPITSDGVVRSFSVVNGNLVDDTNQRVLTTNVVLVDPDPHSSQYNKNYAPFQLTTIGSRRALSINIITQDQVLGHPRYQRMKSTVIIRNAQ